MRWPGVESRQVVIGGVRVTCAQAAEAVAALAAARSTAIRQILKARGSALAGTDYWAVIRDWEARCPAPKATGTKQVHVPNAKQSFARAVHAALSAQVAAEQREVWGALRRDERYAAAIASDAVAARVRAHAAAARARVRAAVTSAVARCEAQGSGCSLAAACGTGQCPFAPEELRDCTESAAPGRLARPARHARAAEGFSDAPAAAWLAAARPWRPAVEVSDSDTAGCEDGIAA
jgi:hypothetical protein